MGSRAFQVFQGAGTEAQTLEGGTEILSWESNVTGFGWNRDWMTECRGVNTRMSDCDPSSGAPECHPPGPWTFYHGK